MWERRVRHRLAESHIHKTIIRTDRPDNEHTPAHTHMHRTTHFADDAIKCQSITGAAHTQSESLPVTSDTDTDTKHEHRHRAHILIPQPDTYLLYLSWFVAVQANGVVGKSVSASERLLSSSHRIYRSKYTYIIHIGWLSVPFFVVVNRMSRTISLVISSQFDTLHSGTEL